MRGSSWKWASCGWPPNARPQVDGAYLRERLAEHRVSPGDLDDFAMHDMGFHREIAGIGSRPIFSALVEVLFGWAHEFHQPIVRAPGAEELTLAEHPRIIDTIASGKPQRAERAVREHRQRHRPQPDRL